MVNTRLLSPIIDNDDSCSKTIWVVFSNDTDIGFLKFLRRGFRHCFIIMKQDDKWILIDPRADKTDIQILPHPSHFNFPRYFTTQGKIVCKILNIKTPKKIAPIIPMSCVETVKRIIGIHRWFVFTPYQLYRSINKIKKKG